MRFSPLDSSEDFMGRCGLHFYLSLIVPSYDIINDVINDVIMSDADCTPGREPRSIAASSDFDLIWYAGRPRPDMRTSMTSTRSKVKVTRLLNF